MILRVGLLGATATLITSCCTVGVQRVEYVSAYQQGTFETARKTLQQTIAKEMGSGDYRDSDEAVWLLLDRATLRMVSDDVEGAARDYLTAIEAMDYYHQRDVTEDVGQLVMQDDVKAYGGDDFEQVLARFYAAVALLHTGDESNAYALLRQCEELIQTKQEEYDHSAWKQGYAVPDPIVGKFLFAALLEKRGDQSNARILYRQVEEALETDMLSCGGDGEATLVVFCHNGNVPRKITEHTDASIASTVALEAILAEYEQPFAMSSLPGIPTPAFVTRDGSAPVVVTAAVEGSAGGCQRIELQPVSCVADMAFDELDSKKPVIVARGVARYLLRRTFVAAASEQGDDAGALADFAMLVANAMTQADTRAWGTLPARIDAARFNLPAGEHTLSLEADDVQFERSLMLRAGDLCVVNLFHIHPGTAVVTVPERFQMQDKESHSDEGETL